MLPKDNTIETEDDIESKASVQGHEFALPSPHSSSNRPLKLDPHGYPLRPQPSDDPLGKRRKFKIKSSQNVNIY